MLAAAQLLGELVVELGKHLLLDPTHRDADRAFPGCELRLRVVVRELDGHLALLVDEGAWQSRQQLGQQDAFLELRLHGLARFRFDDLPVRLDLDIDHGHVARAQLALDWCDLGQRLTNIAEPAFEHLVGDLDRRRVGQREVRHVAQRDLRHHRDRRLQPRGPASLQLEHLHVGVVDRIDRLVSHRLLQHLGDDGLDDLLAQRGRADARLDQLARRPAGPKAFDLRPRRKAVQHALIGRVDQLGRHLDGHADLAFRQRLSHDCELCDHARDSTERARTYASRARV